MGVKLIVFDFDGVIVDSVHEAYIVCLKAFERMGGKLNESPSLEENFLKARAFVIAAEDFFCILKTIENEGTNFNQVDQEKFDELKEKYKEGEKEFAKHFYDVRKELQEKDFEQWCQLYSAFPQAEEIKKIAKKHKTIIGTSKDRNSTFLLLQRMGFDYKKGDITGREMGIEKTEQIQKVREKFSLKPEEILFIEDMFESVYKVQQMGVKSALVSWGYSNEKQKEEAKKLGITIIKELDVEEQIERLIQS